MWISLTPFRVSALTTSRNSVLPTANGARLAAPVTPLTSTAASDNDFNAAVADKNNVVVDNPNQFFVFAFGDADLPGFVPQKFKADRFDDDDRDER
jgi:hypothetical protein